MTYLTRKRSETSFASRSSICFNRVWLSKGKDLALSSSVKAINPSDVCTSGSKTFVNARCCAGEMLIPLRSSHNRYARLDSRIVRGIALPRPFESSGNNIGEILVDLSHPWCSPEWLVRLTQSSLERTPRLRYLEQSSFYLSSSRIVEVKQCL